MNRCKWAMNVNEIYTKYHDEEWGESVHDDQRLYEMLILESFQAGLSWSCILNKRENFRKAFDNFDIDKITNYDETKIQELQKNEGIIRNKLKIKATINNSKIFKTFVGNDIYCSFCSYFERTVKICYKNIDKESDFKYTNNWAGIFNSYISIYSILYSDICRKRYEPLGIFQV